MKTLGFIGGGRITRILLQAFKNANIEFENINIFDTNQETLSLLRSKFQEVETSSSNPSKAASSDLVFIALHPPVLIEVLQTFKSAIKENALVVSLAPKVTIEKLQSVLPNIRNIARMNPNAGTYVNKGYNPVCFSVSVDETLKNEFLKLFERLGKVPVVQENLIEAYAVISAMGHTYFWFQLQQLKELAVSFGLDKQEANETISAMLAGTTETLFNSGLTYEEVVDLVPVKPLAEKESEIKNMFTSNLQTIFQKIKPA